MPLNQTALDVLEYWWTLELLNPQPIPRPTGRSHRPGDHQVVEWRAGDDLPWQRLPTPRPVTRQGKPVTRSWRHTVYLGVYDVEATYEYIHAVFGEDEEAYDERRAGLSACAALRVDGDGVLVPDSAVLSSALWAVARLAGGTRPQGLGWVRGLEESGRDLNVRLDALDGARRDAAGADAPPPQDADSVRDLLSTAQAAAGVAGIPRLASSRIVIESVAVVPSESSDASTDMDFLNSFFLQDLAAVHTSVAAEGAHGALATYLTPDDSIDPRGRVDVIAESGPVDEGVSAKRLPMGRWPSCPSHALALRQQLAVNAALDDLASTQGLLGVNGPPGTGKTTMLRDVLAGNVVKRASRLAQLGQASDAFTGVTHGWNGGDGYRRCVPQLREDLTGFEMVVASANNGAVENISTEIPARGAIDEPWRDSADYFSEIATATLQATSRARPGEGVRTAAEQPDAWGLVAARLGSKANRGSFRSAFWFDTKHRPSGEAADAAQPGMYSRLKAWRDAPATVPDWSSACAAFRVAEKRVLDLLKTRRQAEARLTSVNRVAQREADAHRLVSELSAERTRIGAAIESEQRDLERASARVADAERAHRRHRETRPGVLETLLSLGRAARDWRETMTPLEDALDAAEHDHRLLQSSLEELAEGFRASEAALTQARSAAEARAAERARLERRIAQDRQSLGDAYPSELRSDPEHERRRELKAPWLDAELDTARSELFLAALQLHEDFLACAAGDMLTGLRAAMDVVAGTCPPSLDRDTVQAAWQLFFLVVPMVSTTFASFGRMFAVLGQGSLGWVIIDEAGQACPQYAAGAVWRARRVLAVGDPLQLEPVVTVPAKVQSDLAAGFHVSETWIPPRASVQTLADRVSRQGTYLTQAEDSVWVGSPLTVHRRCDEPMFSLCNAMAYSGMMVRGLDREPSSYCGTGDAMIPPSQWIDVPGTTPGSHLQPGEIERLVRLIRSLEDKGVQASDMIAISPFRAVANRLSELRQEMPGLRAGTIHTAQGRDADVVFLVLGGDPDKPGAKEWAASRVNLVNVAVSRPKRRLYVIGDRASWARYSYFDQLAAVLRVHAAERAPIGPAQKGGSPRPV